MIQEQALTREQAILAICCGEANNALKEWDRREVAISPSQLRQLLEQGLFAPESAYNSQPTLGEYLRFAETIQPLLESIDTNIMIRFKGELSNSPSPSPISESSEPTRRFMLDIVLDSFEIHDADPTTTIEEATKLLPEVAKFIRDQGADDFELKSTRFWAWWD